jgi:hypothetical protein
MRHALCIAVASSVLALAVLGCGSGSTNTTGTVVGSIGYPHFGQPTIEVRDLSTNKQIGPTHPVNAGNYRFRFAVQPGSYQLSVLASRIVCSGPTVNVYAGHVNRLPAMRFMCSPY